MLTRIGKYKLKNVYFEGGQGHYTTSSHCFASTTSRSRSPFLSPRHLRTRASPASSSTRPFRPRSAKAPRARLIGSAGQYEQIAGRAFGELDPARSAQRADPGRRARQGRGRQGALCRDVRASPSRSTCRRRAGCMWHDVPNRGRADHCSTRRSARSAMSGLPARGRATTRDERDTRHRGAADDESRRRTTGCRCRSRRMPTAPRSPGGAWPHRQPLGRRRAAADRADQPGAVPAGDARHGASDARLARHETHGRRRHRRDARSRRPTGSSAAAARSKRRRRSRKLPVQICLKGGFDPAKLYQVVYTAKDPYILGIGFAAWRDLASFFKYADKDDAGTANPLAGRIKYSITRGRSQSGNYPARLAASSALTRTRRSARYTTACGRSSRAAASRSTSAGRSPTACSSSTRRAAKGRSGGCRIPITRAACPRAASSIAATRRRPARR